METANLHRNFFLVFSGKVDKMVVFRPDQKRNRRLIEPPSLPVPFFDRVERALPRQVEHEEDGDGVVTDEWEHVDEFALTAEIPNGEGDFGVADRDGFFHEVDAYGAISKADVVGCMLLDCSAGSSI